MNSVAHFEIYGNEPSGFANFYPKVFGWDVEQIPGIAYWRVNTRSDGPVALTVASPTVRCRTVFGEAKLRQLFFRSRALGQAAGNERAKEA